MRREYRDTETPGRVAYYKVHFSFHLMPKRLKEKIYASQRQKSKLSTLIIRASPNSPGWTVIFLGKRKSFQVNATKFFAHIPIKGVNKDKHMCRELDISNKQVMIMGKA